MDANGQLLRRAFDAAVAAADPRLWLTPAIQALSRPAGSVRVVSLGKAAIPMAGAFAAAFDGAWSGLAAAPAGERRAVAGFTVQEGAHPVPDGRSLAAGEAALDFAAAAQPDDLLLVLVSGGASALACAPISGVSLELKARATAALLGSGAAIGELNAVRRALSRLKGGGLARATGAGRVQTLAMSDVPGDFPADIGSGPAVPSPTGAEEALAALDRHAPGLAAELAAPMRAWASRVEQIRADWTASVAFGIGDAAEAAQASLRAAGLAVEDLGVWSADAVQAARAQAREVDKAGPRALVSCGELSVAVPPGASGRGGRNQHFLLALALAIALAGRRNVWALAADTDGIDGSSDCAGAWIDPDLLGGLDRAEAQAALDAFDAHGFFERHGRLVRTGPTGVNVGDLRLILVG